MKVEEFIQFIHELNVSIKEDVMKLDLGVAYYHEACNKVTQSEITSLCLCGSLIQLNEKDFDKKCNPNEY